MPAIRKTPAGTAWTRTRTPWIVETAIAVAVAFLATACAKLSGEGTGGIMLKEGAIAPDLTGVDQNGTEHRLSEYRGRAVVIYFYPKDATPGCTKEACAFRDAWDQFRQANVQVFGVSADDRKSHEAFARDKKLPFPIVADPDHQWIRAFGVPTKFGKASRVTFLIGPNGAIAKSYPNVDPAIHASRVLSDAIRLTTR